MNARVWIVGAALLTAAGCAKPTVTHDTMRFVNESEAVLVHPVVTILNAPTRADDELKVRLSRKIRGPLYEVDVTQEEVRGIDVRRIIVVAVTSVTGIGVNLNTTSGTTTVQGRPRKIKDVEEIDEPWPSAHATLAIDGIAPSQLSPDRDGTISVRISPILKALNHRPAGALKLTLSVSNGVATDTKVVEVAQDTVQSWFESTPR